VNSESILNGNRYSFSRKSTACFGNVDVVPELLTTTKTSLGIGLWILQCWCVEMSLCCACCYHVMVVSKLVENPPLKRFAFREGPVMLMWCMKLARKNTTKT
jgi:hypothetical protein